MILSRGGGALSDFIPDDVDPMEGKIYLPGGMEVDRRICDFRRTQVGPLGFIAPAAVPNVALTVREGPVRCTGQGRRALAGGVPDDPPGPSLSPPPPRAGAGRGFPLLGMFSSIELPADWQRQGVSP